MDINDLVAAVELQDVRLIEKVGRLKLDPEEGGLSAFEPPPDGEGHMALQVRSVRQDEVIETWIRLLFDDDPAVLMAAAVVVTYGRTSDEKIPAEVLTDFVERVVVMTAYPYLRQAVQSIASELRVGEVVLPIVRQGAIKVNLRLDEE